MIAITIKKRFSLRVIVRLFTLARKFHMLNYCPHKKYGRHNQYGE